MQFALRSEKKVSILDLINLFNCSRLCEILIHSLPLIEFIFMMRALKTLLRSFSVIGFIH